MAINKINITFSKVWIAGGYGLMGGGCVLPLPKRSTTSPTLHLDKSQFLRVVKAAEAEKITKSVHCDSFGKHLGIKMLLWSYATRATF
ncbi:hypothetical protein CHS0354_041155 [Potamilus streckersoni]|uniref:Uncharacterized protein n=1 Tax=Potamilus streckersoni TaxID=2493646 RepID=A0AAE0SER1_9BIVA|nr:hypothetical protein CHS0354_041155 [Potamilus streckersoni]